MNAKMICILWFVFCICLFWHFIILRKFKCPDILKQDNIVENGNFSYTFNHTDKFIIKYTKDQQLIKKTNRYKLYYSDFNWHCKRVTMLSKSMSILLTLSSFIIVLGVAISLVILVPSNYYDHSLWFIMCLFPLFLILFYNSSLALSGSYRGGRTLSEGMAHWKVFKRFSKSSRSQYKKINYYKRLYGRVIIADSLLITSTIMILAIVATILTFLYTI